MRYKNNPANIRYSPLNKWKGSIEPSNGFCQFETIHYGVRALILTLRTYIIKHKLTSVDQIIKRFAPPTENNTRLYISYVCNVLLSRGLNTDNIVVYTPAFNVLVAAICKYETGFDLQNIILRDTFKLMFG